MEDEDLRKQLYEEVGHLQEQMVNLQKKLEELQKQDELKEQESLNVVKEGQEPWKKRPAQIYMDKMQARNSEAYEQEVPKENVYKSIEDEQVSTIEFVDEVEKNTFNSNNAYNTPRVSQIDLEHNIGQNVMGIIASVMIFVGLILFVAVVYEELSAIGQALTLYAVSACITVFGLYSRTKNNNAFAKSMIVCGLGAFYISILMTYLQLELVGQIGMYILITIWMILTGLLSQKIQSSSASIIGQLGITISVLLGGFKCEELFQLYFLLFYVVGCSLFYQLLFRKHESYVVRLTLYIMGMIASISFISTAINAMYIYRRGNEMILTTPYIIIGIILVVFLYVWYIFYMKMFSDKENKISKVVVQVLSIIFSIMYTQELIDNMFYHSFSLSDKLEVLNIILFVLIVLYACLTEVFYKGKIGRRISTTFCILIAAIVLTYVGAFFEVFKYTILWAPILVYGFWKKERFYQTLGIILLAVHSFSCEGQFYLFNTFCFWLGIASIAIVMFYKKEFYYKAYKVALYLLFMFNLNSLFNTICWKMQLDITMKVLFFVLLATINIVAMSTKFVGAWNDKSIKRENMSYFTCRILNTIFWLIGAKLLYKPYVKDGTLFIMILIMLCIAFVGIITLLKEQKDNQLLGLFTGLKLTITIWIICGAFKGFTSIMISSLFLILAIAFILVGFRLLIKIFRVYGLGLSMVAVIKLLLFDLQFADSIQRVIAFFAAGILCFIINFIYNSLTKKYEGNE